MQPKIVVGTLISIALIVGGGIFLISRNPASSQYSNLDEFAQCLSDKKVVMYGAIWCSHCQAQKKLFGDSFKSVPYVECPDDPQRCLAAGVDSYPTWVFADGQKLTGEQKLPDLAAKSGCPLR